MLYSVAVLKIYERKDTLVSFFLEKIKLKVIESIEHYANIKYKSYNYYVK